MAKIDYEKVPAFLVHALSTGFIKGKIDHINNLIIIQELHAQAIDL